VAGLAEHLLWPTLLEHLSRLQHGNLTASADGRPVTKLDRQVALTGMAPWTGISVGVDACGPVSWPLRRRRGTFRYTGDLRAVTYIPGEVRVPAPVAAAVVAAAESEAD
jgi:hypothetical protein